MKPEEFPYITEIKVNDCFAYKDFVIPIGNGDDKPFRHLILTGKNGSGKTTILNRLNDWYIKSLLGQMPNNKLASLRATIKSGNGKIIPNTLEELQLLNMVVPSPFSDELYREKLNYIFAFLSATRKVKLLPVSSVSPSDRVINNLNKDTFNGLLKQYLVNKKVHQAFEIVEKGTESAIKTDIFFETLEGVLQKIFNDSLLKLTFYSKEFDFKIENKKGNKITFEQLSDGFSALMRIILELLVRVDIVRGNLEDFHYEPQGLILLDEPEVHAHLEMQYQVLPLLTTLFPNIQFIVATHSPAVISSLKNAIVYDLTKQEAVADWVVGSSYSELMVKHFGLDNEFSNVADDIIHDTQKVVDSKMKKEEKLASLKKILTENEKYLAPSTMLEVETNILRIEEGAEL